MRKFFGIEDGGFTLVELLIVIALIAILSVAVLATINPIEQANKAKDSTVQNDAAEVLNAYERYYANAQSYPWMNFTEAAEITVDDEIIYQSDAIGFGICGGLDTASSADDGDCDLDATVQGLLVSSDELKSSFKGKAEFQDLGDNNENALWTVKEGGSGGSIYVCYIPKAKSNRQLTDKLYCIDNGDTTTWGATGATLIKVSADPSDDCVALATTSTEWSAPSFNGEDGMFRCVPE